VTASEVAIAEICPYQLYLKKNGAKESKESLKRARYGNTKHSGYNKTHGSKSSSTPLWVRIVLFIGLVTLCGIYVWMNFK